MPIKRGDIVLASLPFTDQSGAKIRPAMVVQCDVNNARLDDVIVAMITHDETRGNRSDAITHRHHDTRWQGNETLAHLGGEMRTPHYAGQEFDPQDHWPVARLIDDQDRRLFESIT